MVEIDFLNNPWATSQTSSYLKEKKNVAWHKLPISGYLKTVWNCFLFMLSSGIQLNRPEQKTY